MGPKSHSLLSAMVHNPVLASFRARAGVEECGETVNARLRTMVDRHFTALWTFCRRLGLAESDVDDAMQETIFITANRLNDIATGCEKSFLFATAFRVASELRRKRANRREIGEDDLADRVDPAPGPEALADRSRAREVLDQLLSKMPIDQRAVFVLYEIEEHSMAEIAELLNLPMGTVASRLRRGRACFEAGLARTRLQVHRMGGAS
jgi:RNA polymerase sigma-70 factor, ECF subfamily